MTGVDESNSAIIPRCVQESMDEIIASAISWWQFRERAQKFRCQKDLIRTSDESEAKIKSWLEILYIADQAGALNPTVLFLLRSMSVEQIHNKRCISGAYNKDLENINSQMRTIEKLEGLGELEYWPIGEGPEDWNHLSDQYDKISDMKFEETLREFGLEDMANLYHVDRKAYEARREQGQVTIFSKTPELDKLSFVQKHFESEFNACAKVGAYLAASIMIGAAIESTLLFACLNDPNATSAARAKLNENDRPSGKNPKSWGLKSLIDIAFAADWFPNLEIDGVTLNSEYLAGIIRKSRNSVHPSRHLRLGGNKDFKHAFRDSKAAYTILKWSLARSKSRCNKT